MSKFDVETASAALPEGAFYLERPPMPPAPLGVRLKTSPIVRRVLPTSLVVARAERKAAKLWRESPETRSNALRAMEAIVAGTAREGELEEIARRHVIEQEAWDALFWQPWAARTTLDTASRELVLAARDSGRPLILSACHQGPYFARSWNYVTIGIRPAVVCGEFWFDEPTHNYWGRRLARWRRGLPDLPLTRPRGSFATLTALLGAGETVLVYYDLPGRHETSFLGKSVMLVNGTARLAAETDALVVPVRIERVGSGWHERAYTPIDPRELDGVDGVHEALARVHERLILEQPEAMADPNEYGWDGAATPTAWTRPQSGKVAG